MELIDFFYRNDSISFATVTAADLVMDAQINRKSAAIGPDADQFFL